MVLEPSIFNELVELIASNFKTDEINELGKLILKRFDSNLVSGTKSNISISPRKSAKLLVECCQQGKATLPLIKLIVELDDGVIHGRPVKLEGLENFLSKAIRAGIHYDFRTGKIASSCEDPTEMSNWGCLKEGKTYDISVVSLDIMGSSALVRKHGLHKMEKLYFRLWSFIREKLTALDGRIWSWAGDGGIVAFAFKDHAQRAVRFAVETQSTVPIFNLTSPDRSSSDIALRFGIDAGKVHFLNDTGKIISDVINFASHMEKQVCGPGAVSISRAVRDTLPAKLSSIFRFDGIFEDADYFTTLGRLDGLLSGREAAEETESRFA
jgi:class 3 adenylate cyclase